MSWTDKDRPQFVQAGDPHVRRGVVHRHLGECDFDPDVAATRDAWAHSPCRWFRAGDGPYAPPTFIPAPSPSRGERQQFHIRERARDVRQLRELVKEYRASGDVEDFDHPCWSHRHGAQYDVL